MSVDLNAPITKGELLELYKEMRLIRMVEQLAAKAYTLKKNLGLLSPVHWSRICCGRCRSEYKR